MSSVIPLYLHALFSFALLKNDMLIHQMDVVTAFLNEKLMYIQQSDGYIKPRNEHLVCELKKSLSDLKLSPRY